MSDEEDYVCESCEQPIREADDDLVFEGSDMALPFHQRCYDDEFGVSAPQEESSEG